MLTKSVLSARQLNESHSNAVSRLWGAPVSNPTDGGLVYAGLFSQHLLAESGVLE